MTWIEVAESPDRELVGGPVMLSARFAVPVQRPGQAARERGPWQRQPTGHHFKGYLAYRPA
jgi:hypothetical protein